MKCLSNYISNQLIFSLSTGLEIYDHALVPSRWTVSVTPHGNSQEATATFQVHARSDPRVPKLLKPLTMEERYNKAMEACRRVCSLIANCGGRQFEERIKVLHNMEELFRMGKEVIVLGLNSEGQIEAGNFL